MTDYTINFDKMLAPGDDDQRGYSLNIGDQLGQYRIVRPLGRGGMGEVYEAENVVNRKRIALKVLPNGAGRPRPVNYGGDRRPQSRRSQDHRLQSGTGRPRPVI